MKDFKVTVKAECGLMIYEVYTTEKGAISFGKKIAKEVFRGEKVEVKVEAL